MNRSYKIEYNESSNLYVQIDGEGYLIKEPCNIEVYSSDQIFMNINKVKTQTSKFLGDILQVLSKAVEDKVITIDQQRLLYENFVRNL